MDGKSGDEQKYGIAKPKKNKFSVRWHLLTVLS